MSDIFETARRDWLVSLARNATFPTAAAAAARLLGNWPSPADAVALYDDSPPPPPPPAARNGHTAASSTNSPAALWWDSGIPVWLSRTDAEQNAGIAPEPAPWPLKRLDIGSLRANGIRGVPFQQFVIKMHSRCNLACGYCYVYKGADQSWADRPTRPSPEVLNAVVKGITAHVRTHGLEQIRVDLHGGEPLLAGVETIVAFADSIWTALPLTCRAAIAIQTNGTLLTSDVAVRLADAGIHVGLSLDGGTAELNRRRTNHRGRSSWPAVERAVAVLKEHPGIFNGALVTIDHQNSPEQVYRSLRNLGLPAVDFLLPHATWTSPPPGPPGVWGRWLAEVLELWWNDPDGGMSVRIFEELLGLVAGRPSTCEVAGLSPVATVIVETDGSIEQVDSLRTAYHGASSTGLDLISHSFDDALDHPGIAARQIGRWALPQQCRDCDLVAICGGGNYAHRFRQGSGFMNPSVYCADMEILIRAIALRLSDRIGERLELAR